MKRIDPTHDSKPKAPARRPYGRPRIVHQERLEAVAADCSVNFGKSDPTCLVGFS